MPDISLCRNVDCPQRAGCYRYRAVPSRHWQSTDAFQPGPDGKCDHWWPVDDRVDLLPTETVDNVARGRAGG